MRLLTTTAVLAVVAAATMSASDAQAGHYRYIGQHPVPRAHGGDFCHIEFPHVHAYAPEHPKLAYRMHYGGHYFVGDPVAHGYRGTRHAYHGAHPIHVSELVVGMHPHEPVVDWCYLRGPHYHVHPPVVRTKYALKGDVFWYMGPYPREFEVARPTAVRINTVYQPIRYERPVVLVKPPSAYVDVFVRAPAPPVAVVRSPVVVTRPAPPRVSAGARLDVHVPVPTVGVSIGGHGHIRGHEVHHGHKHHYDRHKHKRHDKYYYKKDKRHDKHHKYYKKDKRHHKYHKKHKR